MTGPPTITVDVHLTDDEWRDTLTSECRAGLTATPKHLSPVWFYDAAGSELFDAITRLPEYYPTRTERGLLADHVADIVATARPETLVELGSGTSDKTRILLDALTTGGRSLTYVPFDVSEPTIREAAAELTAAYPRLDVHAVVGDFRRHLGTIPRHGRRLVAFLGGTIGNLDPAARRTFLSALRAAMGPDDSLLLGADLVKDPDVLVRAYDDAAGVTAAFNRNALVHLNRRLGGTIDVEAFRHVARWNEDDAWIEMHLRAEREQVARIDALGLDVHFARDEELRTEISAKFRPDQLQDELGACGLVTVRDWVAEPGFQLLLARPASVS